MLPPPPRSTLFPYTTLFRSQEERHDRVCELTCKVVCERDPAESAHVRRQRALRRAHSLERLRHAHQSRQDRKSTRLNSSHVSISYAVFCLKKKKKKKKTLYVLDRTIGKYSAHYGGCYAIYHSYTTIAERVAGASSSDYAVV